MMHRIRRGHDGPILETMRGTIVADETYIGGEPKNRHASVRAGSPYPHPDQAG